VPATEATRKLGDHELPLTRAVLTYVVKVPMALYLQQLGW
jgi:hypothetical protein